MVRCQQCQMSIMSNVNNVKFQQSQMSTILNLPRSVEISQIQICPDLLNLPRSVKIRPDQSRSYEICLIMSKCQPNCQNVNKIVRMSIKLSNVTISNVMCYQIVQIKLAHRLCTDFQYFFYDFYESTILLQGGELHIRYCQCRL